MGDNGFDDFNMFDNNDFNLDAGANSGLDDFGWGSSDDLGQQEVNTDEFSNNIMNESSDQDQFSDNASESGTPVKKQAIIVIVIGVVALLIVLLIASKVGKSNDDKADVSYNEVSSNVNSNVNVDNIMSQNTNKSSNKSEWLSISNSENIIFNEEYMECLFTITNIKHKAKVIDTNNNLVVITTLQGSLSGLSGTYEIDVPYNKGVKLVVGNSFTVQVQLGTYNEKTVVGEIKY